MYYLHSFLSRASVTTASAEMLLTWKQCGIRHSTSANRSSEMNCSETAPRELSILFLWFGAELPPTLNFCSHQWHLWDPWEGLSSPLIMSPLLPRSADKLFFAKGFIWTGDLCFAQTNCYSTYPSHCRYPFRVLGSPILNTLPSMPACQAERWRDIQTFKTFCADLQESNKDNFYEIFARWERSSPRTLVNL